MDTGRPARTISLIRNSIDCFSMWRLTILLTVGCGTFSARAARPRLMHNARLQLRGDVPHGLQRSCRTECLHRPVICSDRSPCTEGSEPRLNGPYIGGHILESL
jgi:hypothetical protein